MKLWKVSSPYTNNIFWITIQNNYIISLQFVKLSNCVKVWTWCVYQNNYVCIGT